MIRYTSQHQLRIIDFKTPFEQRLSPDNRWVILASAIPWDELAGVYHRQMSSDMGRGTIDTRVVIGALIVKHMLKWMTVKSFIPYKKISTYSISWASAPSKQKSLLTHRC